MGHVLNKRLIWKLLRTIGNVLCGISWWGGHNWWACCWGGVHHGALMMLVLPLLGHIWYCRRHQCKKTVSRGTKHMHMVHKALQDLPSCLPLQCRLYHPTPTSATLGCLAIISAIPQPQTPTPPPPQALVILTHLSGVSLKAASLERPSIKSLQTWSHYEEFPSYYFSNNLFYNTKLCHLLEKGNGFIQRKTGIYQKAKIYPTLILTPSFISHHWILQQFPKSFPNTESHTIL